MQDETPDGRVVSEARRTRALAIMACAMALVIGVVLGPPRRDYSRFRPR